MRRRSPPRSQCKPKTLSSITCKLIKNLTFRITTCIKLFLCFPLSNVICPCGGKGTCNKPPPSPCESEQDMCSKETEYRSPAKRNPRRKRADAYCPPDHSRMAYYAGSDTKIKYSDTNCPRPRRKRNEECQDDRKKKRYEDDCEDNGKRKRFDDECEDDGRKNKFDDDCEEEDDDDDDECEEPEPECPEEDRGRRRSNYAPRNRPRPRSSPRRFDRNPDRQRYSEPNFPDNGRYQSYNKKYRAYRPPVKSDHRINTKPYHMNLPTKHGLDAAPNACCKGVKQIPICVERR